MPIITLPLSFFVEVEMKFKFDKMVHSVMNHVEACYTQEIKRLPAVCN